MLSAMLAQQIAGETTEAIGHNVIITDDRGIVIGSGDTTRVGTEHEASLEVIETRESAWHDPQQAAAMRGVRPGMTLPLVIGDDVVGTVGITGSPRQVRRFGLLVRRQTEILLEEADLLRGRFLRERNLEDLLREIEEFDPDITDVERLSTTAAELGFTLARPRVPLLVQVDGGPIGPEYLRATRGVFHNRNDIVALRNTTQCQVLMAAEPGRSAESEARHLLEVVGARFELATRVVVGDVADTIERVSIGLQETVSAAPLANRQVAKSGDVFRVHDLRVRLALASLPRSARNQLVTGTLGEITTRADWPTLRTTLQAWCESGFNLVAAAETLNIHRNTLLYRLEKIAPIVGGDWRNHPAMLTLWVASLAEEQELSPGSR